MKVYVFITSVAYEGIEDIGIYSSLEEVKAVAEKIHGWHGHGYIYECELGSTIEEASLIFEYHYRNGKLESIKET